MDKSKKWNKQKIIDAIRERDRRGLSLAGIRKDDHSLESAGLRWFGSWKNAVLAAGLGSKVRRTWNKAAVVAAIKDRHQRGLPLKNVREYDESLANAASCYFGGWANAMKAAGLEKLIRKQRSWTKQAVIDEILKRNERGLPMTHVAKYDRGLAKAALKCFGSWHNAALAAGLKMQARRIWSKERIIEQIQWWHNKGVPPSKIYRHDYGLRTAGNKYFSGWHNAVRAAGFAIPCRKWSRRLVIEAILERQRRGLSLLSVRRKDRSLSNAALRCFGDWHEAVRAAGIEPKVRRSWSHEIVIKEIHTRLQQGLPVRNLAQHDSALSSAAIEYFGSWNNAYLAAGLKPLTKKWSRQLIIDEIRAWRAKGLSFRKIGKDYSALASAANRYFGGLQKALRAVGVESKPRKKWSQQRVISELQAWYKGGSHKKAKDAEYKALVSAARRHFGSWNSALAAAGLQPMHRGVWSREQVVEEIQNRHVKGLSITAATGQEERLLDAAKRYFGGWANALEAAGIPHQVDTSKRVIKWSVERVIAAIHARYEKGLPMDRIRNNDPSLSSAANKYFRSWHGAMEAAGFQLKPKTWNKRCIVAEIRIRHCPDMGTSNLGTDDMNLYNAAKDHFGSWHNALRTAGITPDIVEPKPRQQWSKQRVIDEIKVRHREGLFMTSTWPANRFLASAAKRYCGGWHNALRAAGIASEEARLTWQKKSNVG